MSQIGSKVSARAWAFEQVAQLPAPLAGLSQVSNQGVYGGRPDTRRAMLREQIIEAEMLAEWVWSGEVPDDAGA